MKLYSLKIEGFRRLQNNTVTFGDATFLIGVNNAGKSTVLRAIEYLLSARKSLDNKDYYSIIDEDTGETKTACDTVIFEAEFRNLPIESHDWRGFKGRIFEYDANGTDETGLCIFYRKTYKFGSDVLVELKTKKRILKTEFTSCETPQDFIDNGVSEDLINELFDNPTKKISAVQARKLEEINEIWDLGEEEEWFTNPGGIPGVVLNKLPRFLLIPANTSISEIGGGSTSVLGKTMVELFQEVRRVSPNYKEAQIHLDKLAKELDPQNTDSEFGKMMEELNEILSSVFPDSKIHATADLNDPDKVLKPTFNVEMSSNVRTPVENQGAGMIRATAFGILRYRQKWLSQQDATEKRNLLVCFEEPEIYLCPSAANQMRDTIYDLSDSESQIIATTHSPNMIDLSRKPKQVLNRFYLASSDINIEPFNITKAFNELIDDDKDYVKMLLRVDDYVARVFFTKKVIIVEGDTEEIVIKESLKRLPEDTYLKIVSDFEIIKARGKASIIGLVKYLVSMSINPIVVHDRDLGIEGAEKFNEPIANAVNGNGKIIQMHECLENILGYDPPSREKPYTAYKHTITWGGDWNSIPADWKAKMKDIFEGYID